MDLTAEQFEDLIGAYALDACEPDEIAAIERYAAANADAAAEVERLREVAAGMGASGASRPPVALRDRLLRAAAERVPAVSAQEALQDETERFDALLDTITDADLDVVTENGLSVHQLVQHVEAIDRAFVAAANDPSLGYLGADEAAQITEADLPVWADETFAETVTRFRRTHAALVAVPDHVPADQRVASYQRDDSLVIRAFETWTHDADIRNALGRQESMPAPAVMRTMSELAMKTLPLTLAARGVTHPGRTARIVLTGAGGGEFNIACAPGEEPTAEADVVLTVSALDLCRRFADRVEPTAVRCEVDGDEHIARDLVESANAFAGL